MSPADPPSTARALIERQLSMLTRLAEIGMEVAEAAGRRAAAEGAAEGAADPALAYARAARAVRMTIALQSRLLKDLADLDKAGVLARSAEVAARRARVHRLVERAIEAGTEDEDEAERLSTDAWERLSDAEDFEDLLDRPVADVVAGICRELGLDPPPLGEGDRGAVEGARGHWLFSGKPPSRPSAVLPPEGEDQVARLSSRRGEVWLALSG